VSLLNGLSEYLFLLRSLRRLLVTANVVPSSPMFVTLMMEALRFSDTSILTRTTRRNIPEDDILHLLPYLPICLTPEVKAVSELYGQSLYMKNGVFWDVTPCGSCKNRRIGGT
jgi:hypothetical protein